MPSRSERQRRYLFMKFGKAWVDQHGFNVLATGAPRDPKRHAIAFARHSPHPPHDPRHHNARRV